jgi:photosystem II stability/assembly factor-like uncharacterized protein
MSSRHIIRLASAIILVLLVGLILCAGPAQAQSIDPDIYRELPYRHIGPVGNRVSAVVGVPGDPKVYYIGAASGGVFKTTDGGVHWEPIFDDQPAASFGALAVAASDPNIVWAGTGETFIRSNVSLGNGIYKSTDAGKTWKHMGLTDTGRIGRVIIHPTNPDIVFAAAMGHCYGPQEDRGVFRTIDGGENWERVLFVDENTGASDLAMDPMNPRILFAGTWPLVIHTWGRESGGPGGGLHVSRDGGDTWKRLEGNGLPDGPLGKVALAIAPSNPDKIYALIETGHGGLWRSDDGGRNWKMINRDHVLAQRPHYYSRVAVAPDDENEVYFPAVRFPVSHNGGQTVEQVPGRHGDNHDIWIDPLDGDRMIVGNDGTAMISINRGKTWMYPRLPIAQMYHVAVDNQIPYNVYGNRQDGPSTRGPSNSRLGNIPIGLWHSVGGCESGFAIPDPADNNIVWSGCYGGQLDRYDERTRHSRSVMVWPDNPMGWAAADIKYRFQWTFPIAISPHDHNKVYVGSQYVHLTTNGGQSWRDISPDLTTNNPEWMGSSGGLTPDNASVEYAPVVFALAVSPMTDGIIWAGTNDGKVWITRDDGANWMEVTDNIEGLPPAGTISNIHASTFDAGSAYIAVDFHQMNIRDPHVYKTSDYGASWTDISSDIPKSPLSYTHCVREDPVRKGLLYVGTENALYVSFNDGSNWLPLQNNLPHAPVHWIEVQDHFKDLVVATYGRGFWIMDDLTPLQQLDDAVLGSDAHLFEPRQAYRFQSISSPMSQPDDPAAGRNPPYGASINYFLKSEPEGGVTLAILDGRGNTIRKLDGTKKVGINRIWWDLRHDGIDPPRLYTSPEGAPDIKPGPEGRPLVTWAFGGRGPMAPPGNYTVKLTVGETEQQETLEVLKDPNTEGTEADIRAQHQMMMELQDNLKTLAGMITQIELTRKQIYDLQELLKDRDDLEDVIEKGKEVDEKLIGVVQHLYQRKLTGGVQDPLRWPIQLYAKVANLAGDVGGSDFRPTDQARQVHELYKQQLAEHQSALQAIVDTDLAALNTMLRTKNIGNIIVP